MTSRVVCPGSYDPVHGGHLDVIRRAAALFDEVVVAILHNAAKTGTFPIEQRIAFIEAATADLPAVRVQAFPTRLIVDIAREVGATALLKGLRNASDYAYEIPMASMNRALTGIETIFLPGDPAVAHLSSSLVKEVCALGGDITGMVPDAVREALEARRG
ncbi:MAG: pantetheine-phosphate adenylyltransferase [Actinobacteria bacterium]|nr:pantetheine-phosphate adenylyltransferase [Actinomycetota bacterium]